MISKYVKNNTLIIKAVTFMLIVLECVLIFKFSSENSQESSNTSAKVINAIIKINPKTKNLSDEEKYEYCKKIEKPIRKLAHFSIYALLGITIFIHISTYKMDKKKQMLITLIIGILYAVFDELHQFFVPGRSCEVKDVCIDTLGVLFGITIIKCVKNSLKNRKKTNFSKK